MIRAVECPVAACRSVIPAEALSCPVCGACTQCESDAGEACLCHRQLELFCCDCPEPAVPGDRQCAEHAPRDDDLAAYRAIQREVAEDRAAEAARERLWWEDGARWA